MSRPLDLLAEAVRGLRARPLRSVLCAGGIALGMAAMVAVVAIPATTRQALLDSLGQDGNLLTVSSGDTIDNQPAPLPPQSPAMVRRITGVQRLSAVGYQAGWIARRTPLVPVADTNGLALIAVDADLTGTLDLKVSHGRFLDAATSRFPVVVLGSGAARALGMTSTGPDRLLTLSTPDGRRTATATVLGILADAPLAPELDSAVLIGNQAARTRLGARSGPTRIYLRADPDSVTTVHGLLAATASPGDPGAVVVGRPSDLLVARLTAQSALNNLALGLGAVALLVGGVGVANAMVVSVLEGRSEIGLRRALGARRGFVGSLILVESTLLCLAGAAAGGLIGFAVTWASAVSQAVAVQVPILPVGLGLAASVVVGLVAGLYPALRAAHLAPAAALRIAG
ncbi:ABC transporter permease [Kribbella sp.]|uniref:ABC transporter permease n=1 Tax=Kribbella sp. TaxID=1871183 RepID=UPI002D6875E1|nr:ABC transporter permease [Kribbella sp.]HZX08372.1 ABC transporter permease [Kribbella sp.]